MYDYKVSDCQYWNTCSPSLVGKHKGKKYATRYLSGVWGQHAPLKFL